jgi:antitoxin (DNA-binding transcriptional repressor) of toxin-antitoxin stability system
MKKLPIEQLPQEIAELMQAAQLERIVITRNGQPFALVVGVENKDEEDLALEFSPAFWRMIEEARRESASVSLEDIKAKLEEEEKRCRAEEAAKS